MLPDWFDTHFQERKKNTSITQQRQQNYGFLASLCWILVTNLYQVLFLVLLKFSSLSVFSSLLHYFFFLSLAFDLWWRSFYCLRCTSPVFLTCRESTGCFLSSLFFFTQTSASPRASNGVHFCPYGGLLVCHLFRHSHGACRDAMRTPLLLGVLGPLATQCFRGAGMSSVQGSRG